MRTVIEFPLNNYSVIKNIRDPICGEDFCDSCGDCLHCYDEDMCYRGEDSEHSLVIYYEQVIEILSVLIGNLIYVSGGGRYAVEGGVLCPECHDKILPTIMDLRGIAPDAIEPLIWWLVGKWKGCLHDEKYGRK